MRAVNCIVCGIGFEVTKRGHFKICSDACRYERGRKYARETYRKYRERYSEQKSSLLLKQTKQNARKPRIKTTNGEGLIPASLNYNCCDIAMAIVRRFLKANCVITLKARLPLKFSKI